MNYETILLRREDHVVSLLLNRPDRANSINLKMIEELLKALDEVAGDKDARVMVLGAVGKVFCGGGDMSDPAFSVPRGAEENRHWYKMIHGVTSRMLSLEIPTIAMVNGAAVGGAFDWTCACDIRIGSENARFMSAFIRVGIVPDSGGCYLYSKVMPLGKALEFLYTGDFLEAKEAKEVGFLNKLVPAAELEAETMKLARRLAAGPPIALRLIKMQAYEDIRAGFPAAVEMASACLSLVQGSQDVQEGRAAFRERRQPAFQGK